MKRELKQAFKNVTRIDATTNCRAYPDEKGIETDSTARATKEAIDCRAYPDEKGIETIPCFGPSTVAQ